MTPAYPKPEKRGKTIGQRSTAAVNERREQVFLRDDYQCVVKGTAAALIEPCRGPNTIQHRVGKGAGGSALFDSYAHLVTMCWGHNIFAEADAEFAAACLANGWSVPRNWVGLDLSRIPVRYHSGVYLLDHDTWDRLWIPEAEFRTLMREAGLA